MKKTIQLVVGSMVFGMTSMGLAAEKWGGVELGHAALAAAEHFKGEQGAAVDAAVTNVSVKKNIQGTAGTATITYKEAGQTKTAELFCHTHEGTEIDCH